MPETLPIPRRIAIAVHPSLDDAAQEAERMVSFLTGQGAEHVRSASIYDAALRAEVQDGHFDLCIALGGDGTMLRAGHLCAPVGLPVLGINLGHFGFLTEVQRNEWMQMLPRLFEGRFRIEQRMMLYAEHWRGTRRLGGWNVLNEIVVCRGQFVRPIRIRASVDGYLLANYVADGLIVATPTGSTAYALAAGGPILPPELRNILLIPVAPHLSVDRAVVLSEGASVTLQVNTSHQAVVSADGHAPEILEDGDEVRASGSEDVMRFVRFSDPGYFYRNLTRYMEQNPSAGSAE